MDDYALQFQVWGLAIFMMTMSIPAIIIIYISTGLIRFARKRTQKINQ